MESNMMTVEVAYALPRQQLVVIECVTQGSTVGSVLATSSIHTLVPDLLIAEGRVGVFGKTVKFAHELKAGDRIEIYRPLLNDPKEARRRKAAEAERTG